MNLADAIAVGSLVVAAITACAGIVLGYVNSEKRKYGLERDFAHLKRNYEQIQSSLAQILTELDHRFDRAERDILELKSSLGKKDERN